MSGTNTPIDEMDDIYGSSTVTPVHIADAASDSMEAVPAATSHKGQSSSAGSMPGIPGLGMLASATALSAPTSNPEHAQEITRDSDVRRGAPDQSDAMSVDGQTTSHSTAEGAATTTPLEILREAPAPQEEDHNMVSGTEALGDHPPDHALTQADTAIPSNADADATAAAAAAAAAADPPTDTQKDATSALLSLLGGSDDPTESTSINPKGKDPVDPEFIEAAKAQQGNQEAEWQYNTSDEDSSSDDSSDSSSDEDSEDEDYEMLDPATAARMLMEDAGEDDDGGPKQSSNHQVRTKNEKPEEVVPKPDVTVTPDMKVTRLGHVENIVDTMLLVKANTSGEYQVLEAGSVLCLENREVIGAVAETLGRVQEPLYVVAFTRPADITEAGISKGTTIFYVDAHSTFVFTEPLKNLKGTDASNLHDEELPAEEMEFSDDEAEAAYKKAKKDAKKNRNAEKNAAFAPHRPEATQPAVQPYTGGAINYDDEPEDAYTPLARPDNLQQILASGVPQIEERARQQSAARGRGDRGRGRGRGDRGRGDRGRARGGGDASRGGRKGPSKSFPDNHNQSVPPPYQQQPLPQKPAAPQSWSTSQAPQQQPGPAAPQFNFSQFGQQQQPFSPPQAQNPYQSPPIPNHQQQYNAWGQTPNPQQYQQFQQFLSQFGGQAGQQQFQFPPAQPPAPGASIPAGAFVNPTFFSGQQQPYFPQQGAPQNQGAAQGPSPEAVQGAQELLRRLGGQQQQ